jgi:hypothetical protein
VKIPIIEDFTAGTVFDDSTLIHYVTSFRMTQDLLNVLFNDEKTHPIFSEQFQLFKDSLKNEIRLAELEGRAK